uniref:Uncharacterized protein n=1 Tax=Coccolithus braarudii TaxID=221442 RepID=A0A7S0L3J1_9EUKA
MLTVRRNSIQHNYKMQRQREQRGGKTRRKHDKVVHGGRQSHQQEHPHHKQRRGQHEKTARSAQGGRLYSNRTHYKRERCFARDGFARCSDVLGGWYEQARSQFTHLWAS